MVYSALYNSASSVEEMKVLQDKIKELITPESVQQAAMVTGSVVKEAVCSMKPRKSDVSCTFTSDSLLNAPDILFEQLAVHTGMQLPTPAEVFSERSFQYWILQGHCRVIINPETF